MLNYVTLQGRLTRDPELRSTPNGKKVANFSVAVDRDIKDSGTDFINIVAWEKTAEFIQKYFSKGSPIVLKGRLQSRSWEKDGKKNTTYEVVADSVYFGGSKKETTQFEPEEVSTPFEPVDGDLPF